MRRRDLLAGTVAAGLLAGTKGIPASASSLILPGGPANKQHNQETTERVKSVDELVTPETKTAISRGLRFLANRQVSSGEFAGAFGTTGYASGPAVTALAGLAFMCLSLIHI